jgi:hypothetical protein
VHECKLTIGYEVKLKEQSYRCPRKKTAATKGPRFAPDPHNIDQKFRFVKFS